MKSLLRWFYLPLFLIGGNGIAIYLVENAAPKYWLILLVLGCVFLSFVVERLIPYDAEFNLSQQDEGCDSVHALVNESLNIFGWFLLPLLTGVFTLAPIWPENWLLVYQLILAILVADIGITLTHYASHHLGFLWRLHAVHHSVKRMYGFNGLMKHPLHQLIETGIGILPLILIGITQEVLALLIVAGVIQLLLQHSNVNYDCGPFKYILAINRIHRFHHLRTAQEGNVNFGFFTTLIDRFLGTAYYCEERQIGVKDLGIEAEPNYPRTYFQQLVYPFQKR